MRDDGLTRYREYGRYGNEGAVRGRVRGPQIEGGIIPNLVFEEGVPTAESLAAVLGSLIDIGAAAGSDDLLLTVRPDADEFNDAMAESARWDQEVEYTWYTGKTCHGFCEAINDVSGEGRSQGFELTPDNITETVESIREFYQEGNKPWWRLW